jgi:anti-anti-sigma factor
MAITCEEYGNVCVLAVDGDLSGDAAAAFRRAAETRIAAGAGAGRVIDAVVDLEKTGFIDSQGLEALLWLKRRCEDRSGRAMLAAPDDRCRKILEITRLAHRLECHDDLPSALKAMRQ